MTILYSSFPSITPPYLLLRLRWYVDRLLWLLLLSGWLICRLWRLILILLRLLMLLLLLLNERARSFQRLGCFVLSANIRRRWCRRQRSWGQDLRGWLIELLLDALLLRLGILKGLVRVARLQSGLPRRLDHLDAGLRVLLL